MSETLVFIAKFSSGAYNVRHEGKTTSSTCDASSAARRMYAKLHGWDKTDEARVTVKRIGNGNDYEVTIGPVQAAAA